MTMSEHNIVIIKKSSHLIETHSIEIARTMYILLFDLYPEFKLSFNNAPSNQHKLLSETLSVYAININNIKILKPALEKIAQTHAKAGVQPEQYKIIEDMMLLAFKTVLVEKATDELIVAWTEAITYVSYLLIEIQKELSS